MQLKRYRLDTACCLYRGLTTASPARQEATRAATGPAAGRDATAKSPSTANQPSQSSQAPAETAKQPGAKLDEKLFTLGKWSQTTHHHSHACTCCSPVFGRTASYLPFSRLPIVVCLADDLSSEDGGSPTAVKGLADLKAGDHSQNASKGSG